MYPKMLASEYLKSELVREFILVPINPKNKSIKATRPITETNTAAMPTINQTPLFEPLMIDSNKLLSF